jgi:hypothetical protein
MVREYRLTIQAIGHDEAEAIESAVRMLNEGADFDEVTFLYETPELSDRRPDSSL